MDGGAYCVHKKLERAWRSACYNIQVPGGNVHGIGVWAYGKVVVNLYIVAWSQRS